MIEMLNRWSNLFSKLIPNTTQYDSIIPTLLSMEMLSDVVQVFQCYTLLGTSQMSPYLLDGDIQSQEEFCFLKNNGANVNILEK